MSDIHVISENDLQHWKKIGRRIRSRCPIHHSRDLDLSISPYSEYLDEDDQRLAGFGFCHSANCGAKVLVQEWNPAAASHILKRPVVVKEPKVSITAKDLERAEDWQRRELDRLNKIYPHAATQLRHERAFAYLAQRGLDEQEALSLLESLGVAYIPPAEEWKSPPPNELRKWCDRIIFPFTCSNGELGYLGRSLRFWQPGMDENEHKQILDEHDNRMRAEHCEDAARYQICRWRKTYRSGFFNASVMAEYKHLYICEGPFDTIPLLLAGMPDVVAIAGTHIDVKAVPKNVFDVTLAYDADMQGKEAMAKTVDLLGGAGITSVFCTPPDDGRGKDWSERYRLHGMEGLATLMEVKATVAPAAIDEEEFSEEDYTQEEFLPEEDTIPEPIVEGYWMNACRFLGNMLRRTCPTDGPLPEMGPYTETMYAIFEAYLMGGGGSHKGPEVVRRGLESFTRIYPWLVDLVDLAEASVILSDYSTVPPSEVEEAFRKLYKDELFNQRGGTIYRGNYMPLPNFYKVLWIDLTGSYLPVYEEALSTLKQKLADLAQFAESLRDSATA